MMFKRMRWGGGYHHFRKPPFQPSIRPESAFGGNATIKVFVWAADGFSIPSCYSRFHHIAEKATPAIKVVDNEDSEHVKADHNISIICDLPSLSRLTHRASKHSAP